MRRRRQIVRYLNTPDGARLAWADAGEGGPLVKAANWMSHLEYDWDSPVWQHWTAFFSDHFRFIRYDERGCGMSSGQHRDASLESRISDFEALVDAAEVTQPLTLLGISQGAPTCIEYAVRHPERVARMILYGGFSRGFAHAPSSPLKTEWQAIVDLARVSWAKDNPAFRTVFTSQFIPEGTDEQLAWFNELCRKATTGAVAATMLEAAAQIDVDALLPQVRVPTIVIHARNDQVSPVGNGRHMAASIPGAEFVELDSHNHVILEHEPAWARFREVVLRFTEQESSSAGDRGDPFQSLTPRQVEILSLLVEGLGNAAIAQRLGISEKTVRNQLSGLFDKLGVWTRAQAIVFARDHDFGPRRSEK